MQNGSARERMARFTRSAATSVGTTTTSTHSFHHGRSHPNTLPGASGSITRSSTSSSAGRNSTTRQPSSLIVSPHVGKYHRSGSPGANRTSAGEADTGGGNCASGGRWCARSAASGSRSSSPEGVTPSIYPRRRASAVSFRHEAPARRVVVRRAQAAGLRQHHRPGRGTRPQERREERPRPRQRHAHHRVGLHQRRGIGPDSGLRRLAGKAGAARADEPVPSQPHRRGQRGRAPEAAGDGPGGGRGDYRRETGLRAVGADLLRRIRRPAAQARAGEDHRGVKCRESCRGRDAMGYRRTAATITLATSIVLLAALARGAQAPLPREAIDLYVRPLVDGEYCQAVVLGLVDDGGPRVFGYGKKSAQDEARPDGDTVFEIGSATKVFTALLLV